MEYIKNTIGYDDKAILEAGHNIVSTGRLKEIYYDAKTKEFVIIFDKTPYRSWNNFSAVQQNYNFMLNG